MKNSIFVIKPYKWENCWAFDDPNVGLVKEPFVGGADTMIDIATAQIPNVNQGFLAVFWLIRLMRVLFHGGPGFSV